MRSGGSSGAWSVPDARGRSPARSRAGTGAGGDTSVANAFAGLVTEVAHPRAGQGVGGEGRDGPVTPRSGDTSVTKTVGADGPVTPRSGDTSVTKTVGADGPVTPRSGRRPGLLGSLVEQVSSEVLRHLCYCLFDMGGTSVTASVI